MTACGPYSLATITYEPENFFYVPVLDERTVLGVLAKHFAPTYGLVKRAGLEKMYASPYPVTLFVREQLFDPPSDKTQAVEMCRSSTCARKIDAAALKTSACLVLKTLASPLDILVENFGTIANGSKIVTEIVCSNGIIHVLQ
jgi:hypothetical protein